ncbi:MAG: hypothetical protein SGI77_11780, partial [Pirellulaceae bacterium]|nr:hypothetical protein [Pirellulaceae bacterium]
MKTLLFWLLLVTIVDADDENIRWLVEYQGNVLPEARWKSEGRIDANLETNGLRLKDDGPAIGCYTAAWQTDSERPEIIVEAKLRVLNTTGAVVSKPDSKTIWPWRDGAPVSLLISDGRHQEGLVFYTDRVSSWTDRFVLMDTSSELHTYRLVI